MELLEMLSDVLIDTLKGFSTEKRPLTSATLKEALETREELISLFYPTLGSNGNRKSRSAASPSKPESTGGSGTELLEDFRKSLSTILDNLAPVISGEYEQRFSMLQQRIDECNSSILLSILAEQIGKIVGELMSDAVERMQFSNNFLVELGKDLFKIEERLSSYQSYNKDTYQISSDFNDDLSSHTNDVLYAVDSCSNLVNIQKLIIDKLDMISKSIETKRRSDEIRLHEADTRIAELQNNLKTYEVEISQVKERTESLEKEVMLDELTQIHNRRAYDLQILNNIRRYHAHNELFSLVLIDIDHFKNVNDTYGHKAGDRCLREVASLIKSSLRKSDFVARYGGEELIAILNGSNAENAQRTAEKIRNRIQKARFFFQNEEIPITISLGVTEITPSDTEPENPFIRVDKAMYQAKKEGRNLVRVYREALATGSGAATEGVVQEAGFPLAVARTDLPRADFHSEKSPY